MTNEQVQAAARDDENLCPHCMRHVMLEPQLATGWLTCCGRRLTRIDECGRDGRCTNDEHGECIYPATPADPALDPATVETCAKVAEKAMLPCSVGGDLIIDKCTGDTIAAAIRALAGGETK